MCGIVGFISGRHGSIATEATLRAATDMLAKRGPDDVGTWVSDGVGLGHRRLSVVDVSPSGHQPMCFEGRYHIVFNGEIYNFNEVREELGAGVSEWQSRSDTEVILAAYARWGEACLSRFRGMFAFVIWDSHARVLFAARDRLGVKPLYYHHSSRGLTFASRPRALFSLDPTLSRRIDEQALRIFLEAGHIPAPLSIFEEVRKLPPAHFMVLDEHGLKIQRYWDFRQIRPERSWLERSEEDLLDELDELLTRSVRLRMIGDVPLGACLSGGIDSSLVIAKMCRYSEKPVTSFTIGFTDPRYDESSHALRVANHLGTEHISELMRVDDLLELMPTFLEEFDEPFFDYSAFPSMALYRLARKHVTVALTGDGGDELFGGYHYYRIVERLAPFYSLPGWARGASAQLAAWSPTHEGKLVAGALRQNDVVGAFAFVRSIAKDFALPLDPAVIARTRGIQELFFEEAAGLAPDLAPAEQGMRLDAMLTLPGDYLEKVDVASMAFSLEAREPLLDHELMEFAMKLPLAWKLRGGHGKYLLRRLAYRYLPPALVDRPKQGFGIPMAEWLRGPLKAWARERFEDRRLYERIPLIRERVLELNELHLSGARNVHPLLWAILALLEFTARNAA